MAAPINVPLGTSANFAILAGSAITDVGTSSITRNVGLSPTTGAAITGLICAEMTGSSKVYDVDGAFPGGAGCLITGPAALVIARTDRTAAYNYLVALTPDTNLSGQDLGGMTLPPGVYRFDTSAQLTGTLILDGNGVYVFQIGSTLTTAAASIVSLINGALPGNVFWQVGSSATLGTTTAFKGNILAVASITATNGATVDGRLFADSDDDGTGAVTMDANVITAPATMYKIQVNYTPQTTGCHNICYKQTSPTLDPDYCCLVDNTVSTPGTPKIYIIDVAEVPCEVISPVDPDTPGTYTYNGYVQPCCAPGATLQTFWAAPVDFVIAAP